MNKEELKQRRDEMFGRLIAWLNDNGRFQSGIGGLFDCGVLGCCYIYQDGIGWICRWYKLQMLPWQIEQGEMSLVEYVEKRIGQIFLDIAEDFNSDETVTEEEAAAVPMTLFAASNTLVQRWRELMEEWPE